MFSAELTKKAVVDYSANRVNSRPNAVNHTITLSLIGKSAISPLAFQIMKIQRRIVRTADSGRNTYRRFSLTTAAKMEKKRLDQKNAVKFMKSKDFLENDNSANR